MLFSTKSQPAKAFKKWPIDYVGKGLSTLFKVIGKDLPKMKS